MVGLQTVDPIGADPRIGTATTARQDTEGRQTIGAVGSLSTDFVKNRLFAPELVGKPHRSGQA